MKEDLVCKVERGPHHGGGGELFLEVAPGFILAKLNLDFANSNTNSGTFEREKLLDEGSFVQIPREKQVFVNRATQTPAFDAIPNLGWTQQYRI